MALEHLDIFKAEPNNHLLRERQDDEAYVAAVPGQQYVIYFPNGGDVRLDLKDADAALQVRWLEVLQSRWVGEWEEIAEDDFARLKTPGDGPWVAVLVAK